VKNAAGAARAISNEVTIVAGALPEQHVAQKKALESAPFASSRRAASIVRRAVTQPAFEARNPIAVARLGKATK
jgi:hypothetical protein